MIAEILEYLCDGITGSIIGAMPEANGIALYCGAGGVNDEYFDRGKEHEIYVTVNAKNVDQSAALSTLETVHKQFTQLKAYPPGSDYSISNIATGTEPNYIGKDANNQQYLYGSVLKITFYQNGVV